MSPGMAYAELGPTHHSIEDLSWMRAIADLIVVVPADPQQTRDVVRWAAHTDKPSYLRIGRVKTPAVTPEGTPFELGKALQLRDGSDVTIVAVGVMVSRALDAAALLANVGISARVLNMTTIAPLDEDAIVRAATQTRGIVTVEEARTTGGLGAAVAETVVRTHPIPMRILGVSGFAPTGNADFLYEHFGLTAAGIAAAARELRS
jgi:transketolase